MLDIVTHYCPFNIAGIGHCNNDIKPNGILANETMKYVSSYHCELILRSNYCPLMKNVTCNCWGHLILVLYLCLQLPAHWAPHIVASYWRQNTSMYASNLDINWPIFRWLVICSCNIQMMLYRLRLSKQLFVQQ